MKAWEKNPPQQWLTAARYGYKHVDTSYKSARQNTLDMGKALLAAGGNQTIQ